MNIKEIVIILSMTSIACSILWILGLIQANILYFIGSLIILILEIPLAYQNRNKIGEFFNKRNNKYLEDERTNLLNGKAANAAFGVTMGAIIYIIIGILTLRNNYPYLISTAAVLILILIISFISYLLAKNYYNKY